MSLVSLDEERNLGESPHYGIKNDGRSNNPMISIKSVCNRNLAPSQMSNALKNVLNEIQNSSKACNHNQIPNKFNVSNTIKSNKIYDMNTEIKLLQRKIDNLAKNLYNKRNSIVDSRNCLNKVDEQSAIKIKIKNKDKNDILLHSQTIHTRNKSKLKKSNSTSCTSSLIKWSNPHQIKNIEKKLSTCFFSNKRSRNTQCQSSKTYSYKEEITIWKEKYYKVMKLDRFIAKSLQQEKTKFDNLTRLNKKFEKKCKGYDKLNQKYIKSINENEKLNFRLGESELTRKDQSNLIISLKSEIQKLSKWRSHLK